MSRVKASPVLALAAALLVIAVPGNAGGDEWSALYRPLQLPRLAPGAACPVSGVDNSVDWSRTGVGGGIGRGPVYAILGERATLGAGFRPEEWGPGPWAGQKVLWFVHQRYEGRVLIRGRRLGGWQWMRFDRGSVPAAEIRIERGETVTWSGQAPGSRGRPSYVRVRAPGCYAAQIDGTSFSRLVVFRITLSR